VLPKREELLEDVPVLMRDIAISNQVQVLLSVLITLFGFGFLDTRIANLVRHSLIPPVVPNRILLLEFTYHMLEEELDNPLDDLSRFFRTFLVYGVEILGQDGRLK